MHGSGRVQEDDQLRKEGGGEDRAGTSRWRLDYSLRHDVWSGPGGA